MIKSVFCFLMLVSLISCVDNSYVKNEKRYEQRIDSLEKIISENKDEIRKTKFLFNMPLVFNKGELDNRNDSVSIYYKQNTILYEVPYIEIRQDQKGVTTQKTKHNYFIFNKGDKKGKFYYYIDDTQYRDYPTDSILKLKVFYGFDTYKTNNYTIIETIKNDKKYSLIEKCLSKDKNFSFGDTTIYYYSNKIKTVEHTLSKYLDSARKQKLVKVRFLHNKKYSDDYKMMLPKREWRFEMREDTIGDVKKYLKFFEKFNKEVKK